MFNHEVERPELIFPIDYTLREYAKEFKRNPRTFRNRVLGNILFRDILMSLAVPTDGIGFPSNNGQSNEENSCSNSMPPIPLETIPFLKCFCQLAQNKDKGYHKTFFLADPRRAKDIENFWVDFCNSLFEQTILWKDSEEQDLNVFCCHILFQNEKFTSALLSPLWEQEVLPRLKKIQELAKQVDFGHQIHALKDCLISLDRVSLALQSVIHNSANEKSTSKLDRAAPEDLQKILASFLSNRQACKRVDDGSVRYNLPNLDVASNKTLEQAFEDLGCRRRQQTDKLRNLLTKAREAYLRHLAEKVRSDELCCREQQYIGLWKYLRASSSQTMENIETRIYERCQHYCQQIINFYTYSPDNPPKPVSSAMPLSYIDELLDFLIDDHIHQALSCFQDTFLLITFYNTCQTAGSLYSCYDCAESILEGNHDSTHIEPEKHQAHFPSVQDMPQEHLHLPLFIKTIILPQQVGFINFFQKAWEFIYETESLLFKEGKYNLQYFDDTVSRLLEDGQSAGRFFSKGELVFSSYEEAHITLGTCCQPFSQSSQPFSLVQFWTSMSKTLQTLLLLILQKVVTDKVPELVAYVSPLLSHN